MQLLPEEGAELKIKDMPVTQRPDERAEKYGTEVLSEAELIAVILRTGTAGKSSLELANEVLSIDKGRDGLGNLVCCTMQDMLKIRGLGKVKALKLACVFELGRRIASGRTERCIVLNDPSRAAEYYMETARHLDHEEAYIFLTDTHNRFIKSVQIARGSIDSAALSNREIIKTALQYDAAGFILVHNHPSGLPEPSAEDIRFSRTLRDAAELMNIRMNDSLIIGEGEYCSLKSRGLL